MSDLSQEQQIETIEVMENDMLTTQNRALGVNITNINKPDYSDPNVVNHKTQFENWLSEIMRKQIHHLC